MLNEIILLWETQDTEKCTLWKGPESFTVKLECIYSNHSFS
jgi:hypothetical protein